MSQSNHTQYATTTKPACMLEPGDRSYEAHVPRNEALQQERLHNEACAVLQREPPATGKARMTSGGSAQPRNESRTFVR